MIKISFFLHQELPWFSLALHCLSTWVVGGMKWREPWYGSSISFSNFSVCLPMVLRFERCSILRIWLWQVCVPEIRFLIRHSKIGRLLEGVEEFEDFWKFGSLEATSFYVLFFWGIWCDRKVFQGLPLFRRFSRFSTVTEKSSGHCHGRYNQRKSKRSVLLRLPGSIFASITGMRLVWLQSSSPPF